MHTQIHRRQEITLDQLHLLRGRQRERGGLEFLLTQFPSKLNLKQLTAFLSGWLTSPRARHKPQTVLVGLWMEMHSTETHTQQQSAMQAVLEIQYNSEHSLELSKGESYM